MGNAVTNPARFIEKKAFGVEDRTKSMFVNHSHDHESRACVKARDLVPLASGGMGRDIMGCDAIARHQMQQSMYKQLDKICSKPK